MKGKLLVLLLAVMVAFTGCGQLSDKNQEEDAVLETEAAAVTAQKEIIPTYSGELTLSMRAPVTLNPILNEDASVDRVLHLLFEPLFNIDDNFKVVPNLASSYELASDGLSAVINLRTDVSWSDGIDVTSKDFKFTLNEIQNAPDTSIYKAYVENISDCVILNDSAVRVEFTQYYSGMEYMFTFPLIPEHYYKNERDPASEKNMSPLGNGPFEFESYKIMDEMVFTAAVTGKRPYIQTVKVLVTPDAETDLNAFNQGVTDILTASFPAWSKFRSAKEAKVYGYNTTLYDFIGFNFNNFYLQNSNLREAIARSVNIDEIITNIYLGYAVKASSPVNPESWLFDSSVNAYPFDLEEAEKLLQHGGFIKSGEGVYAKNEEGTTEKLTLRLLVNEENDERVKIAEGLSENLTALGIEVALEKVSFDEYRQRLNNRDFDLFIGGFNLSVYPDLTFAFHSSGIEEGSNFFSYNNPELDKKLKNAFLAVGEIPVYQALSDVQKHISGNLVVVSLIFKKTALLTGTRIYGNVSPMINNIFHNIREWYIVD